MPVRVDNMLDPPLPPAISFSWVPPWISPSTEQPPPLHPALALQPTPAQPVSPSVAVIIAAASTRCFIPMMMSPMSRQQIRDRKSVVVGKSVSVRVDVGGRRIIQKKNQTREYLS